MTTRRPTKMTTRTSKTLTSLDSNIIKRRSLLRVRLAMHPEFRISHLVSRTKTLSLLRWWEEQYHLGLYTRTLSRIVLLRLTPIECQTIYPLSCWLTERNREEQRSKESIKFSRTQSRTSTQWKRLTLIRIRRLIPVHELFRIRSGHSAHPSTRKGQAARSTHVASQQRTQNNSSSRFRTRAPSYQRNQLLTKFKV